MDVIIVLDKEKLPPDLQEELQKFRRTQPEGNIQEQVKPQSGMFSIQSGTVVGNIYKDQKVN